jgi:PIN domain nuclease of toxin-antitoxin system
MLADACALIALHGYGGQTMSEAGKAAMSAGDVFVCPITVWEISRKIALGTLVRPAPPGFNGSLSAWLRQVGYRILPMTWEACELATALPLHHKDPMDRMLIALALDRGMTVITDDDVFGRYGIATIW